MLKDSDFVPTPEYWTTEDETWVGADFVKDFNKKVDRTAKRKFDVTWRSLPEFAPSRDNNDPLTVESAYEGRPRMCGTGDLAIGLKMIKDKYRTVDLMKHKIMKHIGHPDQRVFLEILKSNPSKSTRPLKSTEEPKPTPPEEPKAGPPALLRRVDQPEGPGAEPVAEEAETPIRGSLIGWNEPHGVAMKKLEAIEAPIVGTKPSPAVRTPQEKAVLARAQTVRASPTIEALALDSPSVVYDAPKASRIDAADVP